MPHVEMKVQTVRNKNGVLQRLYPGMVVAVPTELAEHWEEIGIAEGTQRKVTDPALADKFVEESETRQEVLRTDLRIAALHGDVRAARQLDALHMAAGTQGSPAPDMEEGTPKPLTERTREPAPEPPKDDPEAPKQSTGASARGSLGGGGKG